jgi:hypothetical protein
MLFRRRASVRIAVDNATVSMPGVTDYLSDILAALEQIEQTLYAMRDAIEAK